MLPWTKCYMLLLLLSHNVQKLLMLWFQLLIILRDQQYIKFYSYVKVLKLQLNMAVHITKYNWYLNISRTVNITEQFTHTSPNSRIWTFLIMWVWCICKLLKLLVINIYNWTQSLIHLFLNIICFEVQNWLVTTIFTSFISLIQGVSRL